MELGAAMIYRVVPQGYQTRIEHRWYEWRYNLVGYSKRKQRMCKKRIYRFDAQWNITQSLLYDCQKPIYRDRAKYIYR